MQKVLITAYAVNPYKGSEDGIAWNIIEQMSRHNQVIAITRKNNQAAIENYINTQNKKVESQLQFEYYDLPSWMRFWKKGGRGALLYHYIWHLTVVFFIWKKQFAFDLAHHLNFNNDWTPSFLWLLGKPFIWGPIGHHPKIPTEYIRPYGKKAVLLEQIKWAVKKCFWTFDPFLKITKWKAQKIIALNTSVREVLNIKGDKLIVVPAAGTERPMNSPQPALKKRGSQFRNEISDNKSENFNNKFTVLSIGRLVALKGFDITIDAFAKFYNTLPEAEKKNTQLVIIGKGPQKKLLDKSIEKYNLPLHSILYFDWMDRAALSKYYRAAQVFFFPSHEGAGMVVPEALSYGLPVICFDNVGPGELMNKTCGISVPYSNRATSIQAFSDALTRLYINTDYRNTLSKNAYQRFEERFTWEGKGLTIQEIYENAMLRGHLQCAPVT